jgi:hypothetical protein
VATPFKITLDPAVNLLFEEAVASDKK